MVILKFETVKMNWILEKEQIYGHKNKVSFLERKNTKWRE